MGAVSSFEESVGLRTLYAGGDAAQPQRVREAPPLTANELLTVVMNDRKPGAADPLSFERFCSV
jgi:hypothetical protein